jgi:hypothetical protein
MASKEVADLQHRVLDGTEEFHLVAGIVRDGGGVVTDYGDSRRGSLDELANFVLALVPAAGISQAFADGRYLQLSAVATAANICAGVANKYVAPDKLLAAAVPQVLADAATIAWDMAAGFNARVTLGGNRTFGTPTNPHEGITYALGILQDATGTRVPTWPACFDWGSAGAPTLSTAAGKRDLVFLYCYDAATPAFRASFNKSA